MKKIFLSTTLLLLAAAYSYSQPGSKKAQNLQTTTIKGSGSAPDTIVSKRTELSLGNRFSINYKKQESSERVLKPYFIVEMVSPDKPSHSWYLEHTQAARQKLAEVKSTLLKDIVTKRSYADYMRKFNISTEADINSITFLHLPIYYISPNIVLYKDGDNIAKYYNLSTGALHYILFRDNKLLGTLEYSNGKTIVRALPHNLVESYSQIRNAGKKPIGLSQSVSTVDPKIFVGGMNMFGYMEQGHLVYSEYSERLVSRRGPAQKDSEVHKRYVLQRAESSIAESGGPSVIQQWLDTKINNLNQKH